MTFKPKGSYGPKEGRHKPPRLYPAAEFDEVLGKYVQKGAMVPGRRKEGR